MRDFNDSFNDGSEYGKMSPEEKKLQREKEDGAYRAFLNLVKDEDLPRQLEAAEHRLNSMKSDYPDAIAYIDRLERDLELIQIEIRARKAVNN